MLNWINNPTRIIKLLAGLLLIGISLLMLIVPEAQQVVKKVVPL